jgi:2-polyprenyl-3-methyl-5-hydroxy-6-metoxy-1,4-benzoquinol methylase
MERNEAIKESWDRNADLWLRAVREGLIASRRAGTDQAVLDAIAGRKPKRLLDVGCGEGWLVRRAREMTGCAGTGFDACAALIEAARAADPQGCYEIAAYDDIVGCKDNLGGGFDCIVCNYGLFEENITPLLEALRRRLKPNGAMVIQTLHPAFRGDDGDADGGWQLEDFAVFQDPGWEPMPWYARSLEAWRDTLHDAGLRVAQQIEPRTELQADPLSLILVCTAD